MHLFMALCGRKAVDKLALLFLYIVLTSRVRSTSNTERGNKFDTKYQ